MNHHTDTHAGYKVYSTPNNNIVTLPLYYCLVVTIKKGVSANPIHTVLHTCVLLMNKDKQHQCLKNLKQKERKMSFMKLSPAIAKYCEKTNCTFNLLHTSNTNSTAGIL